MVDSFHDLGFMLLNEFLWVGGLVCCFLKARKGVAGYDFEVVLGPDMGHC